MTSSVDFSILSGRYTQEEMYDGYRTLVRTICPEYTTDELSDIGNAIAFVLLGVADHLHLRYDMEANQLLVEKVVRKSTFKSLAQVGGFDLDPPSSATANVTLTLNTPPGEDTPIPKYHSFSSSTGQVNFLYLGDGAYIPATSTSLTIAVTEGRVEAEVIGVANGTENQTFVTQATGILQNEGQKTCIVKVGNATWDVVTSLAEALPSSLQVRHRHLADGRSEFMFGDGVFGRIPQPGLRVTATFVVGGGTQGNVGAGSIDNMATPLYTPSGAALTVRVVNAQRASGGTDEQSVLVGRKRLPGRVRSNDRAVTLADHEAQAKAIAGVGAARAARTSVSEVTTYVVASGSVTGMPSGALLAQVEGRLRERAVGTDEVVAASPTFVYVDVEVSGRAQRRYDTSVAQQNAYATTSAFFSISERLAGAAEILGPANIALDPGGNIYLSDYINLMDDTEGVANLLVGKFSRRPVPELVSWSGSAEFDSVPTVTTTTRDETITVAFVSSTQFRVTGTVSGYMGSGELDAAFSSTGGQIAFHINSGSTAMNAFDYCTIRTSDYVGNIYLDPDEVAILGSASISMTS